MLTNFMVLFPIRSQVNLCLRSSPILKILTSISFENKFLKIYLDQRISMFPPTFRRTPSHLTVSQCELLLRLLCDLPHQTQVQWDGKETLFGFVVFSFAIAPATISFRSGSFCPANTSLHTGT